MEILNTKQAIDWLGGLKCRFKPDHKGPHILKCWIPDQFDAYVKIFHWMYEDTSIDGFDLTWGEAREIEGLVKNAPFGMWGDMTKLKRIRWSELCDRYGVDFNPELGTERFTEVFATRSWPRRIVAANEGTLEMEDCEELTSILERYSSGSSVYLYYDFVERFEDTGSYSGKLSEVMSWLKTEAGSWTPTYWWPQTREWVVFTYHDMSWTYVAGSRSLIDEILVDPDLESIEVTSDSIACEVIRR